MPAAHPNPAEPPPPEAVDDPAKLRKLELGRNFAFHLLKGIKQIGMYRHATGKFPEYLAKAHEAISAYTSELGPLSLKVEQKNFGLAGEGLFTEETSLAYKFYRDGIRALIFRPGLTIEELTSFTLIALSEPEHGSDDVLSQLWKSALANIEYVVVEGFKMDEVSEQEVQVEVDKIVSYLHGRLRSNSEDFLRFARVSTEDLDHKLDGVDQIRGAVITGITATDDLKARVQKEIEEEENQRLFPKLVSAVFQVVESGVDDTQLLEEMFVQLLDAMLIQEDFGTINQVVLKLRAMEQRDTSEAIARLRRVFVSKMGEEQRLSRIGDLLKAQRPRHPADITRYLAALDTQMVPTLLSVLETVEIPENRTLICDVLVGFAKEIPDPFVNRITSERPQTVRDMVYVLEKAQHADRFKMFAHVLRSKNLAVKLDVMQIIARGRTGECRRLIAECLSDPTQQIRVLAARLLPEFGREQALTDLTHVIRDANFAKRTPEERGLVFQALGSTGLPGAEAMMTQLLQQKPTLFNKAKVLEDKLLAVQGLQGVCTVQSYKQLQEIAEDKAQPPEVHVAARKAMSVTRKVLFAEKAEGES
jgi:hypothetical protein